MRWFGWLVDQTVAPGWQPWTAIKAPMDPADTDGRFSGYQRIAATPPSSSYSYSCLLVKSLHFCHQVILQDLRRRKKVYCFHCFAKFIGVFRSCSPTHFFLEVGSRNEPLKSGIFTLRVSHFCKELFMP